MQKILHFFVVCSIPYLLTYKLIQVSCFKKSNFSLYALLPGIVLNISYFNYSKLEARHMRKNNSQRSINWK